MWRGAQGLVAIMALVLLALPVPGARAVGVPPPEYSESLVASGLSQPVAIAFLPTGDLLVTEKQGTLKKISPSGTVSTVTTFPFAQPTCTASEMGLLGVAVDPSFTTSGNGFIYLYRSSTDNGNCNDPTTRFNRVERITLLRRKLTSRVAGRRFSPASAPTARTTTAGRCASAGRQQALRVVGDTGIGDSGPPGTRPTPTPRTSLAERQDPAPRASGAPAAGNPFLGTPRRAADLRLRLPQPVPDGLRPATASSGSATSARTTIEELDIMQAGGNYSWPYCEGTLPAGCMHAGDIAPVFEYGHSGPGVSGAR